MIKLELFVNNIMNMLYLVDIWQYLPRDIYACGNCQSVSNRITYLKRLRFLRLKNVHIWRQSDYDGLKNPEVMNPSSHSPVPSKEGQDRKCHCHNVASCVWETWWKRQLGEKLSVCKWLNVIVVFPCNFSINYHRMNLFNIIECNVKLS